METTAAQTRLALQGAFSDLSALKERLQKLHYPLLTTKPHSLYLIGAPVGLLAVLSRRTVLSAATKLPTCRHVLNIYHPYDPLAFRLDPLIAEPDSTVPPAEQLAHHQGRKRIHLDRALFLSLSLVLLPSDLSQLCAAMFV
eukprot:m.808110 g.808110  ORF g.808110 m.808110 type:complete len:141 (+) comp59309_c0_seq17:209-631(+)